MELKKTACPHAPGTKMYPLLAGAKMKLDGRAAWLARFECVLQEDIVFSSEDIDKYSSQHMVSKDEFQK
eukprot:6590942-Alexandrium_andersonii.AAC.1